MEVLKVAFLGRTSVEDAFNDSFGCVLTSPVWITKSVVFFKKLFGLLPIPKMFWSHTYPFLAFHFYQL